MKVEEVSSLLEVLSTLQYMPDGNTELARNTWFMSLDMNMSLEDALAAVVQIAATSDDRIGPKIINDTYLAKFRKPHEQAAPKPRLPGAKQPEPTRQAPLQIGAEVPVKPQDVPEYVAARREAWGGDKPKVLTVWSVECPHCGAKPGRPCTRWTPRGPAALTKLDAHPSREDLYAEMEALDA